MAAGIAIPATINKALTTGSFTIFHPGKCDSGHEKHPPRYDASREQQHGKTLGADELTDHCCAEDNIRKLSQRVGNQGPLRSSKA